MPKLDDDEFDRVFFKAFKEYSRQKGPRPMTCEVLRGSLKATLTRAWVVKDYLRTTGKIRPPSSIEEERQQTAYFEAARRESRPKITCTVLSRG